MQYPFSYDVTLYNTWFSRSWTTGALFPLGR